MLTLKKTLAAAVLTASLLYLNSNLYGKNAGWSPENYRCKYGAVENFTSWQNDLFNHKLESAQDIASDLQGECPYVKAEFWYVTKKDQSGQTLLNEQNQCIIEDKNVTVGCYREDKFPLWQINLDRMCWGFLTTKRWIFGLIRIDDRTTVSTADGSILTSPDLSARVARILSEKLSESGKDNTSICQDYILFMQQNFGPGGAVRNY